MDAGVKKRSKIRAEDIIEALKAERDSISKGFGFLVDGAQREGDALVLRLKRLKGVKSQAVDDALEGCRVVWGEDFTGRGEVVYVRPEEGEVILRHFSGSLPAKGSSVRLFQRDFLSPIIDLWSDERAKRAILKVQHRTKETARQALSEKLPTTYNSLRSMQFQAVEQANQPVFLLYGPPGTGKTYTVGAIVARLLTKYRNSRIIITGPTNVAVDGALIAADQWLGQLGRSELRSTMKRLGAWFEIPRYTDRQHLLADGVYQAACRLEALEHAEPSPKNVNAYVRWKAEVEYARAALRGEVSTVASDARVIAATTATLARWHETIAKSGKWHFVVCDEASQVPFPVAWCAASLARRAIFAGDPNQLAPVVQSNSELVQRILGRTVFDRHEKAAKVMLNEQSRMTPLICAAVSKTFYEGKLRVCELAEKDPEWSRARSAHFVDGREMPRIHFEWVEDRATWSADYSGKIRLKSALAARDVVDAIVGSYGELADVLLLTPFRAQRALLRKIFREDGYKDISISTVHRSQGSERNIVIFDPVAGSEKFLNSRQGRRLINVAVSRAKTHVVVVANREDLGNPWLRELNEESRREHLERWPLLPAFAVSRSARR